jgi:hypothetical protein
MSRKRQDALVVVDYFIPQSIRHTIDMTALNPHLFGLEHTKELAGATSPQEAFFALTERGIRPEAVSDLRSLLRLMWGQRYMAMHEKMYRGDFKTGRLAAFEFADAPEPVQRFVQRIQDSVSAEWEAAVLAKPL